MNCTWIERLNNVRKVYFCLVLVGFIATASLVFLESNLKFNMMGRILSSNYRTTPARNQTSKIKIGVLTPTTSRGIEIKDIKSFSLVAIAIKSLNETLEPRYEYTMYAGVDVNDSLIKYKDYIETLQGALNVVMVPVQGGTFTKAVNAIAEKAIKNGMDYLLRINDDVKSITYNWTSLCIESLLNNDPPNVGVVGPTCRQGKTGIMTTDFVHVTHYNIFGFYYPPQFDNWWTDDWMTGVYKPHRSTKLTTWEVNHKMSYGRRYDVDKKQEKELKELIKNGNKTITAYLSHV